MGKETPTFGEGSTPWTAGIYIEGETLSQPVFFLDARQFRLIYFLNFSWIFHTEQYSLYKKTSHMN